MSTTIFIFLFLDRSRPIRLHGYCQNYINGEYLMITENRVSEFLTLLPKESWLRRYVNYASKQTTSPMAYHIVGALSCLSALTPSNVGLLHAGVWPIRSNFFGVMVGRSGDDQKSTACYIAKRIISEAQNNLIQPNPVSPEGLQESLGDQSRQTLVYSEFGQFLTQTKQGYGEGLKTLITDLWDCSPVTRRKAKKDESVEVKDPRLSIISACALPFLSDHTNASDWTGGFLARWFFIHANRERHDSWPNRNKTTQGMELAHDLRFRSQKGNYFCGGIEDDAFELWDQWCRSINSRKLPKIIEGLASRIPTHCLRVILLLAFDLQYTHVYEWTIDTLLVSVAIEITEMYIDSLKSISENLEPDEDSRIRKNLVKHLKENGGFSSLGDFLREYRYSVSSTRKAIEWLSVSGYISKKTYIQNTKDCEREDVILRLIE
jgi:hypothetical protein